jgi:hypothetical protein
MKPIREQPIGAPASWRHRLVNLGDPDFDPERYPTLSRIWFDNYVKARPRGKDWPGLPTYPGRPRLSKSEGRLCLLQLAGLRCPQFRRNSKDSRGWDHSGWGGEGCLWLGADHSDLWICDGKPYSITSQPYGVQEDQAADLRAKADALNLVVRYSSASWHYPGSTVLVEVRPRAVVEARGTWE